MGYILQAFTFTTLLHIRIFLYMYLQHSWSYVAEGSELFNCSLIAFNEEALDVFVN